MEALVSWTNVTGPDVSPWVNWLFFVNVLLVSRFATVWVWAEHNPATRRHARPRNFLILLIKNHDNVGVFGENKTRTGATPETKISTSSNGGVSTGSAK